MAIEEKGETQDVLIDLNWLKDWHKAKQPKPPLARNTIMAFLVGGLVCMHLSSGLFSP